ncbi:hypothetical protein [Aeromonas hydrophila]|uniref:hypothetical protein n=2 Tax=Aeromonas hydrophila TaxID=644 RepID=UPI00189051E0|nr:hypothetical protein [Aeromonas hydrophila]
MANIKSCRVGQMFLVERSKKTPVHGWLMLGSNCFARLLRQEFIYHIDWIGRAKPMSPSQDGMQPLFHSGCGFRDR